MKKFLLTICLLCAGFFANAQLISFGVKGGVNASTLTGGSYNEIAGYHVGGLMQIKLLMFGIQPEVLFSTQGGKSRYPLLGSDALFTTRLSYLTVPIMFQLYLLPVLNIEVGSQVGFLLSGKNKLDGGGSVNIKDELNAIDLALNVGAAFQLPIIKLGISARYSFGMTNIFGSSQSSDVRNSVFQVSAFYRF